MDASERLPLARPVPILCLAVLPKAAYRFGP